MRVGIGFDTSCYTTSVASCNENGDIISSHKILLPVPLNKCGLRQSEAVFAHVKQLPDVIRRLKEEIGDSRICAVAASATPRDMQDSYMPVFTVGKNFGKAMADLLGVPFCETSHQQGHIEAGLIGNPPLKPPFLALHISGGTMESLLCAKEGITLLGHSLDIHAGQLVDRLGVMMGFQFPAGAELEQLALTESAESLLPVSMRRDDLDCHLSGAETQCRKWMESGACSREKIAAEAFDFLARTVARMIAAASKQTKLSSALIVGGVASSQLLRDKIPKRLQKLGCPTDIVFGQKQYASDNAAGVARIGMRHYLETEEIPCSY